MRYIRFAGLAGVIALLIFTCVMFVRTANHQSERTEHAVAAAKTAEHAADSLRVVADSFEALANLRAREADGRGQQVARRVAVFRRVTAPDTCAPFIAARDSAIDLLFENQRTLEQALDAERAAASVLRARGDTLRVVVDTLVQVVKVKPPARRVSFGVFAGKCIDGSNCAGAGVIVRVP
jgi:hypothetical protein